MIGLLWAVSDPRTSVCASSCQLLAQPQSLAHQICDDAEICRTHHGIDDGEDIGFTCFPSGGGAERSSILFRNSVFRYTLSSFSICNVLAGGRVLTNSEKLKELKRDCLCAWINGTCCKKQILQLSFPCQLSHLISAFVCNQQDMFVRGTDTTTATVEWALTELIRSPEKMARAKQELIKKVGLGFSVEEQDILQLPYLDALMKETMRLHPAAPFLLHCAETDVEVCGSIIPKHTQVLVNVWSITKDPACWKEPTKFQPERFLDTGIDFRGRDLCFIPFGAGRRICPGMPLAARMVKLLLASPVHNFDWKLPNGMEPKDLDMKDKFGLTVEKAEPLAAIPVRVATS
ncbi:geraniol 8-hydroxylase-like [Coffea eugenioides]|uniref:geraniol 8-hydroxylase-like n=1 Tax=Coffea eugenioides TaxID=49369 RepID=UPI000F60B889|nr:geraniol 8-hydroxylase-like [Coffea eugenioides]